MLSDAEVGTDNGFGVRIADVVVMSKVLKIWARKILFGPKPDRVLPNDPLPGLSPPTMRPKPPIPYDYDVRANKGPTIETFYTRFRAMHPKLEPSKRTKDESNWPDSMRGL